jgi:hypothetical protein
MTIPTSAAARPGRARPLARRAASCLLFVLVLAACGNQPNSAAPAASGTFGAIPSASASGSASPLPTATPSPTPQPTPQYTNPADEGLAELIPERVGRARVVVPPVGQFAITPGDIGEAFGDIGLRFTALQVAFVEQPRLSLFAMRVSGPEVTTEELEPYLETAGRYVGIAGLVREPWELERIGRRVAWVRPEDNATALGTMIYTWAAGDIVFLMIGVDDDLNRAFFRALPGDAAPASSPRPTSTSGSSEPSGTTEASASPAGS